MLQHLLLMLAAPPLLVWSRPALIFLWALPRRWRKAIGRLWAGPGLGRGTLGLSHPVVVWFAFCGVFAFWHLPGPYDWAFTHPSIHVLEHVSFFVTALAFWSIVMAPYGQRRLSYPGTLVFILTTAILSGLPGALMIFSPRPFYSVHAAGAAAWHMSLLEDQQIAGLVMWIPAGMVYVGAALWVFAAWLKAAEVKATPGLGRYALVLPLLILLLPALGACERKEDRAPKQIVGADLVQGARLMRWYGCGGCHQIPGIDDANGRGGPVARGIARPRLCRGHAAQFAGESGDMASRSATYRARECNARRRDDRGRCPGYCGLPLYAAVTSCCGSHGT